MCATRIVFGTDLEAQDLNDLREQFPKIDILAPGRERFVDELDDADALIGGWGLTSDVFSSAPGLRWYHHFGVGVDRLPLEYLADTPIVITNNRTVRSSNIAEHVLAMMLGFARGLPEIMRYQVQHEWHHADHGVFEIGGQTLGVVGLGSIGSALAWRADALGMRVLGFKNHPAPAPDGVESIFTGAELQAMLGECDHVAICLPLTTDTEHMFSTSEFAAMKASAYIYNIGRGRIIDQTALIEALQNNEISGAGLDVTDPEPLPEDSQLWDMPNVQITCHTSGATPSNWARSIDIVTRNIERFLRDEPLEFVVDKRAGY